MIGHSPAQISNSQPNDNQPGNNKSIHGAPFFGIVVLQHNNSSDTIECLESLNVKELPAGFSVFVVDNASKPDELINTKNFIQSQGYKRVQLIESSINLGYAGGNNLGVKKALAENCKWIVIINIWGPLFEEKNKRIGPGKIHWLKPELKLSETRETTARNVEKDEYLTGACLVVKKQVFEKLGGFDERFFLYFEDVDFCQRALKSDFKIRWTPDLTLIHKGSATTEKLGSPLLLRYHYRNAFLFNWKNGPLWVKLGLFVWIKMLIFRQLVKLIFLPRKRNESEAILGAVMDFLNGRFGKIH
jgi:GT2 family glycosyltransferase